MKIQAINSKVAENVVSCYKETLLFLYRLFPVSFCQKASGFNLK